MSSIQSESTEFIPRCKCCLKDGSLKSLWADYSIIDGDFENYGEMITECFSLSWKPRMDSDDLICDSCIGRLRDSFNFKREVLASEQVALEIGLNKLKHETNDEDYDIELIEEADDEGTDIKTESMDDSDVEYQDVEYLEEEYHVEENSTLKHEEEPEMNRMKYTEESLKRCITAVTSKGMTKDEAARVYNIPRKVITNKIVRRGVLRSKHLINVRTILQCSNATPFRGHSNLGFLCCICPKAYQNAEDLKIHTLHTHREASLACDFVKSKVKCDLLIKMDITSLKCLICAESMEGLEELVGHLKNKHNKKFHKVFENFILPFKFPDDVLRCVVCYSEFVYFKRLVEHMKLHYSNYECETCSEGFINERSYKTHLRRHNVGAYPCNLCDKVFRTKENKRRHEIVLHMRKNKNNKCSYCDEFFVGHANKRRHEVQVHGARPIVFKCESCCKTFETQVQLNFHVKCVHLNIRPHKCDTCDFAFYTKNDLQHHIVKHTNVRNYQCSVCDKRYTRKNTLATHMRIHLNDKRFKCEYCGEAFVQKVSLKRHMRTKHSN